MSRQVQDAYIVAATRTPIGKAPKGVFRNTRSDDLLVASIRSAMKQVPSLDPKAVEDAIIGCAMPEAEQGLNMARIAVLLAGLPNTTGGMTINRFCSSGLNAVAIAADRIRVGEADVMLAGGAESMSMVPMSGNKPSFNAHIFEKDENFGIAYGMGLTAEKVAFKPPPEVKQVGEQHVLTFAVNQPTDVEVAVLDAKGKIVRHLAAGVLGGKNPPPAPLLHAGQHRVGDGDDPTQVDCEHAIPQCRVGFGEPAPLVVARVVHEHVYRSEVAFGRFDRAADRVVGADIELVSLAVDLARDVAGPGGVQVGHRHARALGGEPPAGGCADPGGATRHERCASS